MSRRIAAVLLVTSAAALMGAGAFGQTDWIAVTPLPVARFEAPSVALNGRVYIFGGFFNLSATALEATADVHVYDVATDSWAQLASMPTPSGVGLTHNGVAFDGDRFVWSAGGFLGDDPGPAIDAVWRYDLANDSWSTGPGLPEARGGGGLARVGRSLHFIGGVMSDRNTDAGDHYVLNLDDLESGWTSAAPLPTPRNHFSTVVLHGRIYTIGGEINHDIDAADVEIVEVYDPADDSWTTAASLPAIRSHFEPGTFVRDGRIVIVGGKSGALNQIPDITEYDPITNIWTALPPLPVDLRAAVAQAVGSRIFIAGGGVEDGYTPVSTAFLGSVPPSDGSWSGLAPLVPWREEAGVAAAGGKVYVVGGHDANGAMLDIVSVYSPVDDSWSTIDPLPGPARDSIGVASVDDKVYAFGGLTGWPGPSVADVYMYDPANPAAGWTPRAELPVARGAMGVAVVNGKIYAAGGLSDYTHVGEVTVYDPVADAWTTVASMPTARDHLTAAAIDGKLLAVGGRFTYLDATSDATEVYDPATDSWSVAAAMLTGRGGAGSGVLHGRLFVFGGDIGTTTVGVNEEFDPATNSWRAVPEMIFPRSAMGAAVVGGRIFAPGGKLQEGPREEGINEAFVLGPFAHVLVVTHTEAFRHTSIAIAEETISRLGQRSGLFTVTFCRTAEDVATMLTQSALADVDVIVFANTTGSLPVADLDEVMNWIRDGGGFVGMHSAADTYHDAPAYREMLGNEFLVHGAQTTVDAIVENPFHPASRPLGLQFRVFDEIYKFTTPNRGEVTMLLSLDRHPDDGLPEAGQPGDLPLAWAKDYGLGRVFYTALGHREDVWQSSLYQQHILGGIQWVLRR